MLVMYPKGRVSRIQEDHMRSVADSNTHLYEVEGSADEIDVLIKKCYHAHGLASINAINWARVMIQVCKVQNMQRLPMHLIKTIVMSNR